MLKPLIIDSSPDTILFNSELNDKDLIIEVLTRVAQNEIIIDECMVLGDTDWYKCHSGIGDFDIFQDGEVEVVTPSADFANKLIDIFR